MGKQCWELKVLYQTVPFQKEHINCLICIAVWEEQLLCIIVYYTNKYVIWELQCGTKFFFEKKAKTSLQTV